MCECVERVKAKVFNELFLKTMANEEVVSPRCYFENSFIGGGFPLCLPIRVDYLKVAKSGREMKQHKIYNMTLSFCPFCGEKVDKSKEVAE